MALTTNLSPAAIALKKIITFSTNETPANQVYNEGHDVILGNFVSGVAKFTLNGRTRPYKFVIELGSERKYALKFHLPQDTSNSMYITYAIKNSTYDDGWQDFTSSVPTSFITALTMWLNQNRDVPKIAQSRTKTLTFYVRGRTSGLNTQASQPLPFRVKFRYSIGG